MTILLAKENGVATVTFNRPDKLNALSGEMYRELADTFAALGSDDAARSAVLIGAGCAFCAGGDIGGMGNRNVIAGRKRSQNHHRMIQGR
jgi:enoyl-CoA hydratase/carnithine racemase